jgi:hypothetical protein
VNAALIRIKEASIKDPLALTEDELGAIVYPHPKGFKGKRPKPDMGKVQGIETAS